MSKLLDLYDQAESDGIGVYWFDLWETASLSCQAADGTCSIAMDPWRMDTVADETVKLAHELGHCETGSFYNRHAALDIRQKYENRADRWAIKKLIPKDELRQAFLHGYREVWELAELFGVTEPFVMKAMEYYRINH